MLRKDIIQKGLEKRANGATLGNIEKILEGIGRLSPVEKLLLYLKLPTHNSPAANVDTPSAESSKSTTANNFAVNWIKSHLEENPKTSIPKQHVHEEYRSFCMICNQSCINTPEFGRLLRSVFSSVRPRRLGRRGCAQYVYGGVCYIRNTRPNQLPVVMAPSGTNELNKTGDAIKEEQYDDDDDDDDELDEEDRKEEMIRRSSIALVMEWACNLLQREFDDIHQLARHLVVHRYVGQHSADAYTVIATSPLDDLSGSKLVVTQAPVPGQNTEPSVIIDESAQKRQEVKNSLLNSIQKRNDIRTQKSRMEASRMAVHEGAGPLESMAAEVLSGRKASADGVPLTRNLSEVKRKVTPTPKTILPKLPCYNTSVPQSGGIFQNSDNQVTSISNGGMQSAQFVILSPAAENGNMTTVSNGGNSAPSLFLISSPLANQRNVVDSKPVIQNSSANENTSHPLQSSSGRGLTASAGLSNSNKNATCLTTTSTATGNTFISPTAQNLSKIFSSSTTEVGYASNATGNSLAKNSVAAMLQNKSNTNFLSTTPLPVQYSDSNLNPKAQETLSREPNKEVSVQTKSNVILTRNSGLHLKLDTSLRPSNNLTLSNGVVSKLNEYSKSVANINGSIPSPTVNVNLATGSQVDSLQHMTSLSSVSLQEEEQGVNKELTQRSRAKIRNTPTIKVRSPNKTVSSLLREVKGGTGCAEDGKKFQNDSRPVSELLKESRREKRQTQPLGPEENDAARLIELVHKKVGKAEEKKASGSIVTLSSTMSVPQPMNILDGRNMLNPAVSSTRSVSANNINSVQDHSSTVDLYNNALAEVLKCANGAGNFSINTLQVLAAANGSNGILTETGDIFIALPNSNVSGISGIQIPVSRIDATNQSTFPVGGQMTVKLPASNEQLQKLLLKNGTNNLSAERFPENSTITQSTLNSEGLIIDNLTNKRFANQQRRIHPQLLQGSAGQVHAVSSAQRLANTVGSKASGGSQLAKLLSVKDEDKSANLAATANGCVINGSRTDILGKRFSSSGAGVVSSKRQCTDTSTDIPSSAGRRNPGLLRGPLLERSHGEVLQQSSSVNNCEMLGPGSLADMTDRDSTYMNSSVKNFTLQQLLEKSGPALARIKPQNEIRQQQIFKQQQQNQLLLQHQKQQLQQSQQQQQQLQPQWQQQQLNFQPNSQLQELKQFLQERLSTQELQQVLQETPLPEPVLRQLLARLQPQQQLPPDANSGSSRPASALLEHLSGACLKSPAVYLSHSTRPSTVAAFTFDNIPLDSGTLPTSSLVCDNESRDSDNSTPMSALLSPHTGNFTPLQLYDSLPMTGTVKPMAKVAPPSSLMLKNVSTGGASTGNFVPSQKSCFAPLSGQMGINLHSVPAKPQRHQTTLNGMSMDAKDILGLLSQSQVAAVSSRNQVPPIDTQNQGFAPVSSILPLKRARTGVDKGGAVAGGVGRGRQRHRSAQEIHGTEGAAQIESIARMLQSSCDEMKQQQGNATSSLNPNGLLLLQPNNSVEWSRQLVNCISPFSSELSEINQSEGCSVNEDTTAALLHRSLSEPSTQALLAASEVDNQASTFFMDSFTDLSQQEHTNVGSTLFMGSQVSMVNESGARYRGLCGGYQGSGRHSRGDHMISGATLNPSADDFSVDPTDFTVGLTNQPMRSDLGVTSTPPSSQNSSPEFGVELIGHRSCYIIEPEVDSAGGMNDDVSGLSLDTPNSIEANTSTDFDRLLSNMCDDGEWPNNVS